MRPEGRRFRATGFYAAAALIAYGLYGAFTNDLYIPGRRGDGVHLHFDAIAPALLGITLFALTLVFDHFKKTVLVTWMVRALKVGALVSMAFALHAFFRPAGREVATFAECQATFKKLAFLTRELSSDGVLAKILEEEGMRCREAPILKTYYECVERAEVPSDVNGCHDFSKMLFERKNAT